MLFHNIEVVGKFLEIQVVSKADKLVRMYELGVLHREFIRIDGRTCEETKLTNAQAYLGSSRNARAKLPAPALLLSSTICKKAKLKETRRESAENGIAHATPHRQRQEKEKKEKKNIER
ncbi:hypothetical protein PUN28_007171 [Cardiocondyla obscurior]|uniref:Uncharacterized protein n=1 Tax=Cardiocondyla obscurior TaxID=286306 RepID=A0AAW2G3Y9_9HYME